MARKPMVTRTFQTTYVSALCVDTVAAEMFNKELTLPRTYKTEADLLKAAQKLIDTDTVKCVAISASETRSEMFGQDEAFFIANATKLDPETRRQIEAETNTIKED